MAEWLDIDGVSLNVTGCCRVIDTAPLLDESDVRGSDRLLPGTAGVIARVRRETVTVVNLNLAIEGYRSFAGATHTDTRTGLVANIAYLRKYVTAVVATGDGTRTATLHLPSGSTLTRPCHVLGRMTLAGDGPYKALGVLRLSFPQGLFDLASLAP